MSKTKKIPKIICESDSDSDSDFEYEYVIKKKDNEKENSKDEKEEVKKSFGIVNLGGNFLLNIGPNDKGDIIEEEINTIKYLSSKI